MCCAANFQAAGSENDPTTKQELVLKHGIAEFLKCVPVAYHESVKKAILKIDPNVDLSSIDFESLLGGFSGAKLFKFKIKNIGYVLRLLSQDKKNELRRSEIKAHQTAAKLGIAPKIYYVDSQKDPLVIVMEFIDCRILSQEDLNNETILKKSTDAINIFQNSSVKGLLKQTRLKAAEALYKDMLQKGVIYPSCFDEIFKKLKTESKNFKRKLAPTHGDPNPANILIAKDGKVYLIDWSEARMDNPFIDIGWLLCMSGANKEQTRTILKAYLSKDPTDLELKEAAFFRNLTNFVFATLWIAKQKERAQEKLDALLADPSLKKISEFMKKGEKQKGKVRGLDDTQFTRVALGWIKELQDSVGKQIGE